MVRTRGPVVSVKGFILCSSRVKVGSTDCMKLAVLAGFVLALAEHCCAICYCWTELEGYCHCIFPFIFFFLRQWQLLCHINWREGNNETLANYPKSVAKNTSSFPQLSLV